MDGDFASRRRAFTFTDSTLSGVVSFGGNVSSLNRVQLRIQLLIFCRNNFETTEMKNFASHHLPHAAQAAGQANRSEAHENHLANKLTYRIL